jgi:hypothetical protein
LHWTSPMKALVGSTLPVFGKMSRCRMQCPHADKNNI